MDFALSDEHQMLRDSARNFLQGEVDLTPLLVPGATVAAGGSGRIWRAMAALGWSGLVIPEDYGGLGMSHVDLLMIVEQTGRSLAPCPLFGTLAGSWALIAAGSEAQKRTILPQVADGTCRMALANAAEGGHAAISARGEGQAITLHGSCPLVVDAGQADRIVVVADYKDVARYFLVDAATACLSIEELEWRDTTRDVCRITLDGVPAEPLEKSVDETWPWIRDRLLLVLAAESAGGLQHVLDASVDYAKERVAFGRPIGAYQAIKHALADMKAQVECASVAVLYAAWALDVDPEAAPLATAMAQSYASEAFCQAAFASIQIFGAIGFTWEMRNHLYFKRARANAELLGSPARQRAEIFSILAARQRAASHA